MLKNTRRFAALVAVGALTAAAVPAGAHAAAPPTDTVSCVVGAAVDFAKKTINHQPYLPHTC